MRNLIRASVYVARAVSKMRRPSTAERLAHATWTKRECSSPHGQVALAHSSSELPRSSPGKQLGWPTVSKNSNLYVASPNPALFHHDCEVFLGFRLTRRGLVLEGSTDVGQLVQEVRGFLGAGKPDDMDFDAPGSPLAGQE